MRTFRLICLVIVALFAVAAAGVYAQAEGEWKTPLKIQLEKDKRCALKSVSKVRVYKVAGKEAIDGRAHCLDGQDYDFSWRAEKQKFEFRRCQPVLC